MLNNQNLMILKRKYHLKDDYEINNSKFCIFLSFEI
jgi:hypothetical protein